MMQSTEIKTINKLSNCTISNDTIRTISPSSITSPISVTTTTNVKNMKMKWGGSIVSRILPSCWSDYQAKKPIQDIAPVSHLKLWRSGSNDVIGSNRAIINDNCMNCSKNFSTSIKNISIEKDIFNLNKEYNQSQDNNTTTSSSSTKIVLLDITLYPIQNQHLKQNQKLICHLKRNINETIESTLRRLEINLFRKILNYYESLNKQLLKQYHDQQHHNDDENLSLYQFSFSNKKSKKETKYISKLNMDNSVINNECAMRLYTKDISNSNDSTTIIPLEKYKDMTNEEFWKQISYSSKKDKENILTLSYLHQEQNTIEVSLKIKSCPPTITSITTFEFFESVLFATVPVVITIQTLFTHTIKVIWYVDNDMVQCEYDKFYYIPKVEDIGKYLSVELYPIQYGYEYDEIDDCIERYYFRNKVEARPYMPIVHPLRSSWCNKTTNTNKSSVRVLTYNLLADLYASREIDHRWFYAHCSLKYLDKKRRMPMLLYEILQYDTIDIICLQEVDQIIFDKLLLPVLKTRHYDGFYSNKANVSQREGCAMFWNLNKFDLEVFDTFSLRDLFSLPDTQHDGDTDNTTTTLNNDDWNMKDIYELLSNHDSLRFVTNEKVGQIVQIATLKLKQSTSSLPEKIIVANTHLFYHPMASHIRAMQAYCICKQIDTIRTKNKYPFLFIGDFNSHPKSGAIHLLLNRVLYPSHKTCWKHLDSYDWENCAEEWGYNKFTPSFDDTTEVMNNDDKDYSLSFTTATAKIPTIALPNHFPKLISGYNPLPDYTNYAKDFIETLDYIFASSASSDDEEYSFLLKQSASMPTRDDVLKYVAMPNEVMPSDHVSLLCDFELKKT